MAVLKWAYGEDSQGTLLTKLDSTELEDIVTPERDTHEDIDDVLRSFIDLAAQHKRTSLQIRQDMSLLLQKAQAQAAAMAQGNWEADKIGLKKNTCCQSTISRNMCTSFWTPSCSQQINNTFAARYYIACYR